MRYECIVAILAVQLWSSSLLPRQATKPNAFALIKSKFLVVVCGRTPLSSRTLPVRA